MRIAVFSDVHGNLPALELMLKDAMNIDEYICLGDVVNYGPWSNECVQLISSLPNATTIRGNHEEYFLAKKYNGKNKLVQAFFDIYISNFSEYNQIRKFRKEYIFHTFTFTHTIQERTIYANTAISLDRNYVIGHSHHQYKIRQGKYVLYNPGSVGQNRMYINIVNYLIYDSEKNYFEMKALAYQVDIVINEMVTRKYPKICIDYYRNKKRLTV